MAKQSLATKYRPNGFDQLSAQDSVKDILANQIETETFQHAYLFTGPAGCGKTTSARIFANMINKHKGSPIEIDAASNSGVDNIRVIIDDAKKKPLDCEYKCFIIDECHSLSNGAWQALLKLLEESPKYAIFILATTDPQKIPATIISRVQRFQFQKIPTDIIVDRLEYILDQEELTADTDAIKYIAKVSNGGMRDAITLMDKCISLGKDLTLNNVLSVIGDYSYNTFMDILTSLCEKNEHCIEVIEQAYNDGQDMKRLLKEFIRFTLDCEKYLLFKNFDIIGLPNTDEIKDYLKDLDIDRIKEVMAILVDLNANIRWDTDPKTSIELMFLKEINS